MFIKTIKQYLSWLVSDGLLVQCYFMICGVISFGIACLCAGVAYEYMTKENDIFFLIFCSFLAVAFFCISFLWFCVGFLHPETKWAKAGLKMPLDDVDWLMIILIPAFFIFAATITTILKWAGIHGYPIKYYEKLYG